MATAKAKCDKEEKTKQIMFWLRDLPPGTLCVYLDGSSTVPAYSAYGYAIYRGGELIASGGNFLPGAEVFDAEITGAVRGLEAALEIGGSIDIKVLLDNQEAVRALQNGKTNSSQVEVMNFWELRKTRPSIEVYWVPGHSGIPGNEKADAMAKAILTSNNLDGNIPGPECIWEETHEVLTFAALKRQVNIRVQKLAEECWLKNRSSRYEDLDLLMRRKRPPELALPRWAYHRLIAARTGHGDFASYHRRFHHQNEEML